MDTQTKVVWSPFTPGYFDNPHTHLRQCREQNPIHQVLTGSWIFFRHRDVHEILSSDKFLVTDLAEFFKEKEPYVFKNSNACPYLAKTTQLWPMHLNNDQHKQTRAIIGKSINLKDLDKFMAD